MHTGVTEVVAGFGLIGVSGWAGLDAPDQAHLHYEVHRVLPIKQVKLEIRKTVACHDDATRACVPVDPYGWTLTPDQDLYKGLTGVENHRLWED